MPELIFFIAYCIKLYMWVFIVDVLLNWLVSLNIVNTRNQFVYMIGTAVSRLTSPVLQPILLRMGCKTGLVSLLTAVPII